jgi:hypothetical protein
MHMKEYESSRETILKVLKVGDWIIKIAYNERQIKWRRTPIKSRNGKTGSDQEKT